ncbi:MAG: DUF2142 domain-containing protein [Actinobacteria bacterium]|nr:DUF2142 domain-containing protein [Actinomycetota bacterium]
MARIRSSERPAPGKPDFAASEGGGRNRLGAAGAVLGVLLVMIVGAWFMLQRSDRMLDSNAVGVGSPIAQVETGHELCVNAVYVPAGTRRVRMWLAAKTGSTAHLVFHSTGRRDLASSPVVVPETGDFRMLPGPDAPAWPIEKTDRICLRVAGSVAVGGAFVTRLRGERPATLGGRALGEPEPAIAYFSGANDRPTQFGKLGDIVAHSQVFHGWAYPWLMALSILLAVIGTAFGLWLVVTAPRHSVRRLALAFMCVGFLWGAAWAFVSPPFQGNDEPEHFANLQYLAATGHTWDQSHSGNTRRSYSSRQQLMLAAIHHRSVVVDGAARPFWTARRDETWRKSDHGLRTDDGGGYTVSASGHGPGYYMLFAVPYRLTTWMRPANQLVLLRILNALLAALVPLLAVLTAALLLGGRRYPSAAAGAAAAVQPMAGYSAGSINNDTAVIVLGALILWLTMRIAVKGWDIRRSMALGAAAAFAPVGKATGTSAALFAAFWVAVMALRDRTREAVRGATAVLASVVATCVAWLVVSSIAGWPARLINVHTGEAASDPRTIPSLLQRVDYIIQTFIPFIHLTGDQQQVAHPFGRIYIVGGWAEFMWHRITFPIPVYLPIAAAMLAIGLSGLAAIVRHRSWLRGNWLPVGLVITLPVAVVVLVGWAYATPGGRPILAEQGRYILPALSALCVAGAGAIFGLPARLRTFAWGLSCGLMSAFAVVCLTFVCFHVYA